MLRRLIHLTTVVLVLFAAISSAFAADAQLPELKAETHTLAVFKNGLGYFIKSGEVSPAGGWAVIGNIPDAAHGSIWLGSTDADTVVDEAIGLKDTIEEKIPAVSIQEILSANIGKIIIITTDRKIKGTLVSLLNEEPSARQPLQTYQSSSSVMSSYQPLFRTEILPLLAALETGEGTTIIRIGDIKEVVFPDEKPEIMTKSIERKATTIKIHVESKKRPAPVSLSYLRRDILWAPSYIANISDHKKASITMQAVLMNDAEDIAGADVFFVVGYPNFAYANVLSPLAMKESVAQFISAMQSGVSILQTGMPLSVSNIQQTFTSGKDFESKEVSPGYTVETGASGESSEDLFFYKKEGVTLPRGGRAYYNIFSSNVEYEHVYEWKIPNTNGIDFSGRRGGSQGGNNLKEQVWHSIKLTNSTPYPWTTAPAVSFSGWKPIAQDMLEYTPKGTKKNLKLTVASDIKVDRNENEIERVHNQNINYSTYDLVTVKGTLSIRNTKADDLAMEIEKTITGKVLSADNNGQISAEAENLHGINQNSVVKWQLKVPPGKTVELTYKYTVYVTR